MSTGYRDDIFANMSELLEPYTAGLSQGEPFPRGFTPLKELTALSIYGNFDCIKINTFENFSTTNITVLNVRSGELIYLESYAFGHLANLMNLSLSNNLRLGFANMSEGCWYGLQFTKIEGLFLRRCTIDFSQGSASVVTKDFFQCLDLTKLKYLYLDDNILVHIDPVIHISLPHLEVLSLSYNVIQDLTSIMWDINHLRHLRYLSFAYQPKTNPRPSNIRMQLDVTANMTVRKPHQNIVIPGTLESLIMAGSLTLWTDNLGRYTLADVHSLTYIDYSENI